MNKKMVMMVLMILMVLSFSQAYAFQNKQPVDKYSPSTYGLPEAIAGYEVVAVIPLGEITCSLSGHQQIILRAIDKDVEVFLQSSRGRLIQQELDSLPNTLNIRWDVSVSGSPTTLADVESAIKTWND